MRHPRLRKPRPPFCHFAHASQRTAKNTPIGCGRLMNLNVKHRFCNKREVLGTPNRAAELDEYALPTDSADTKCFTSLDAASGLYRIPLHEDSTRLAAFITPLGRCGCRCLPFEVSSAPEIFQRETAETLTGLQGLYGRYAHTRRNGGNT